MQKASFLSFMTIVFFSKKNSKRKVAFKRYKNLKKKSFDAIESKFQTKIHFGKTK